MAIVEDISDHEPSSSSSIVSEPSPFLCSQLHQQTGNPTSGLRHRIPLEHPDILPSSSRSPLISGTSPPTDSAAEPELEEEEERDEWFNMLVATMPCCFLYLLLDMCVTTSYRLFRVYPADGSWSRLVHLQYQHRPTVGLLTRHMLPAVPSKLTLPSSRHKAEDP